MGTLRKSLSNRKDAEYLTPPGHQAIPLRNVAPGTQLLDVIVFGQGALLGGANIFTALNTFSAGVVVAGGLTVSGAIVYNSEPVVNHTGVAVNVTATLTAAQVATGYITTTSAAAVTMTMPTGTLLGAAIGAKAGTRFKLLIDNTAGANTVTVAVGVNNVQSDWDNQITVATASGAAAPILPLAVVSGVSGMAEYTFLFSSATACTFSRTA